MIALPSLAGVPGVYTSRTRNPAAARCALALVPPGPIRGIRGARGNEEFATLEQALRAHVARLSVGFRVFRPAAHLQLRGAPDDAAMCLWVGNAGGGPIGTVWTLKGRLETMERAAPGLGFEALRAVEDACDVGAPIYTPRWAMGLAEWVYWGGNPDESEVLAEIAHNHEREPGEPEPTTEELAAEYNILTRKQVERLLSPSATRRRKPMPMAELERLARRRGKAAELARRVLALRVAVTEAERDRHYPKGERHTGELQCLGWPAMLRWTGNDAMTRILDDYAEIVMQDTAVEEQWCWLPFAGPQELRRTVESLATRFAIARRQEDVIELIATLRTR